MKHIKISELYKIKEPSTSINIKGWIKTKRSSKNISFIEINDGSCINTIQVVAEKKLHNYNEIKKSRIGSSISVDGLMIEAKRSEQKWELNAEKIKIKDHIDNKYPLQKKEQSDEFLRSNAHFRMRTNKYGAIFRIRSYLFLKIHDFFKKNNFLYINTPIITSSDCEGAGDMFSIDNNKSHLEKKDNKEISNGFFKSEANLTVSGQLSLEMFALSMGNVYTFGPTFRAENSNTSRHVAEFWMLEPEIAFNNLQDIMKLSEKLIKYLIKNIIKDCYNDINFLNYNIDKNLIKTLEQIISKNFIKIKYEEAISILLKEKTKFEFKPKYGDDLKSEHERFITEKYFKKPVFIFDYPEKIKPFYMRINDDNETVAAMDLLVPRIGEIIGGSEREERLEFLKSRMKKMFISEEKYWWYLDSRKYGSAKHSGFGMGFERLLMLVTGVNNIRDVIPFPRTPGKIDF